MSASDALFTPFKTAKINLPNRVVMAPMARNKAPNFVPGEELAAYYARRAELGVGLIITEASFIDHPVANGHKGTPAIFGDEALAGYRTAIERVHAAGGKIFCQLWHMGGERPQGGIPNPELDAVCPSGLARPGIIRGIALNIAEIREIRASFARAAADAKRIGFDGVEIHGAHGYLIDAFIDEATNLRDDLYGGNFEKRLRFATEVIEDVRSAVGDDFPVSLRISQWKNYDYAAKSYRTPYELETAVHQFAKAGIDFIHCSTRRFWDAEFEGSPLGLAGWAKKLSGLPTIAVGSVTLDIDISVVEDASKGTFGLAQASPVANVEAVGERLLRGEFDLIAVGRALLANPDWVIKVSKNKIREITPYSKEHMKTVY